MKTCESGTIAVDVKKVVEDVALCDISGTFVEGGVIFIPRGPGEYLFEFELNPGTSGVTWASQPFSSRINQCPDEGDSLGWLRHTGTNGNTMSVEAKTIPSGKAVVHYALHFDKPGFGTVTCDPIIIREAQ